MTASKRFRELKIEAADAFQLAAVYWSDGALGSAATKLSEVADLLWQAQDVRNAELGIEASAPAPTVTIPAELAGKLAEFFDRTMGRMNVGASALDAQAIANWNECSGGVEKYCRQDKKAVSA